MSFFIYSVVLHIIQKHEIFSLQVLFHDEILFYGMSFKKNT